MAQLEVDKRKFFIENNMSFDEFIKKIESSKNEIKIDFTKDAVNSMVKDIRQRIVNWEKLK